MLIIGVGFFTLACLLIKNPNKTWIVVSFISKVAFVLYAITFYFCLFLYLENNFGPIWLSEFSQCPWLL